ncbi:MAG: MFS transporter [Methanolobus sp.]
MNKNRLIIYVSVFLIMAMSNSVIPVLPEIAAAGNVSSGTIKYTLLFSGYFIGALLTMIPFGFLADIYNKTRIIYASIALTFFAGLILIITDNIYLLIAARLIEGIACGAFFPPAYALLSGFRHKNRYIGEFNFLLNAGLATGVLVSSFIADWSVKGALVLFTGTTAIIFIFSIVAVLTEKKPEKMRVKQFSPLKETKKAFNTIFNKNFMRIWITAFLIFGITGVMLAFYSDYSKDFLSKPELGIIIAVLYASSMATNLVVGRINVNFRKMIFAGIIITAAGIIFSISHPFIGFTLIGIGSGTGMIGLPVAVSHMPCDRGLAMGIFNTYTYAGLAFMPLLAGLFINLGYPLIFTLTACVMLLTLFIKDRFYS